MPRSAYLRSAAATSSPSDQPGRAGAATAKLAGRGVEIVVEHIAALMNIESGAAGRRPRVPRWSCHPAPPVRAISATFASASDQACALVSRTSVVMRRTESRGGRSRSSLRPSCFRLLDPLGDTIARLAPEELEHRPRWRQRARRPPKHPKIETRMATGPPAASGAAARSNWPPGSTHR